jgi:hypothetical protein
MSRTGVILIVLVLALGLVAWLVLQRPGESSITVGEGATLAEYDSAAVDKLVIRGAQGRVVLEKQAGAWTLAEPIVYPADGNAVGAAVGKARSVLLGSIVSTNPAKQALFQVDSAGTLVEVYVLGNQQASFRVGKPGASWTETYVRREGSDEVFLAGELLTTVYNRAVKEWRDKSVFNISSENIRSIAYQYGDTTFALVLTDSVWNLDGEPVPESTVRPLLTSLSSLQTDDFVDSTVTAPPPLVASILVEGTQIRFHHQKDAPAYLVQTSASPRWYSLQQWRVQQVLKRRAEFAPAS